MNLQLISIWICILVIWSCDPSIPNGETPENQNPNSINSDLLSQDTGSIHGSQIGDEKADVMRRMKPHIVSEMPDEITAKIPLSIKDSTYYQIDYDFRNNKLYSIDLDFYPNSMADCLLLFDEFRTYYNSAFGQGQEKDGFMVWYTISESGEDIEIMMMDESDTHKKPYLAITFYQEANISK